MMLPTLTVLNQSELFLIREAMQCQELTVNQLVASAVPASFASNILLNTDRSFLFLRKPSKLPVKRQHAHASWATVWHKFCNDHEIT
jgi:hypothetical protein